MWKKIKEKYGSEKKHKIHSTAVRKRKAKVNTKRSWKSLLQKSGKEVNNSYIRVLAERNEMNMRKTSKWLASNFRKKWKVGEKNANFTINKSAAKNCLKS